MRKLLDLIKGAFQKDKLSHLYLLSGEDGSALYDNGLACVTGVLTNFKNDEQVINQIKHLNHPDFYLLDKGDEVIIKDDIIQLQNEFSKTSSKGNYRCFVINNIDNINSQAANSMLKFLEEPSLKKTLGILLTYNLDKVIPTILSRSQVLHLPGISRAEFIKQNQEHKYFNSQELFFTSLFTREKSILEQFEHNGDFKYLLSVMQQLIEQYLLNPKLIVSDAYFTIRDVIKKNNQFFQYLIDGLYNWLLIVLKHNIDFSKEQAYLIRKYHEAYSEERILQAIIITGEISRRLKFNIQTEIQLLNYLIKLSKVLSHEEI